MIHIMFLHKQIIYYLIFIHAEMIYDMYTTGAADNRWRSPPTVASWPRATARYLYHLFYFTLYIVDDITLCIVDYITHCRLHYTL